MVNQVRVKLEEDDENGLRPSEGGSDVSTDKSKTDMVLLSSDRVAVAVHRERIAAQSPPLAFILRHLLVPRRLVQNSKHAGTVIRVPYTRRDIAFMLPYLYNLKLPRIVSLTFVGVWGAIDFAVQYQVRPAAEAFTRACRRYSTKSSSLEHKSLAFFVAVVLRRVDLVQRCFEKIMHHNVHHLVLRKKLERLVQRRQLPHVELTRLKINFLLEACHRRNAARMATHRTLYKQLKDAQVAHHALPALFRCKCDHAVLIEEWWSYAGQATQHDLKAIVARYEGQEMCNGSARRALHALWSQTERVEVVGLRR